MMMLSFEKERSFKLNYDKISLKKKGTSIDDLLLILSFVMVFYRFSASKNESRFRDFLSQIGHELSKIQKIFHHFEINDFRDFIEDFFCRSYDFEKISDALHH